MILDVQVPPTTDCGRILDIFGQLHKMVPNSLELKLPECIKHYFRLIKGLLWLRRLRGSSTNRTVDGLIPSPSSLHMSLDKILTGKQQHCMHV